MTGVVAGPRLLAGYTVLDLLRQGEDLVVYGAYSQQRYCRCILKTTRLDRPPDASLVAALELEARLLLSFTHPNWVRAYALHRNTEIGVPVLVLESLTGPALETLLSSGARRLTVAELVHIGAELCSAIAYLHDHGYLHLDVNPANVVVGATGCARLLDLSLATAMGARCAPGMGTPAYLSPEQARGDRLTAAADSWGIGLTLYEATTGQAPFHRATELGTDYPQLTSRADPVRRWRPRLPRPLRESIDACLSPAPAGRPAIAELRSVFDALAPDD